MIGLISCHAEQQRGQTQPVCNKGITQFLPATHTLNVGLTPLIESWEKLKIYVWVLK